MIDPALREAIIRSGGVIALSRKLGITRSAVYQWKRCPVIYVLRIEKLTGIPREKLRPEIYPPDDASLQNGQGYSRPRPAVG